MYTHWMSKKKWFNGGVHWSLNPGLLVNELVFGSRLPYDLFIDENGKLNSSIFSYVLCHKCNSKMVGNEMGVRHEGLATGSESTARSVVSTYLKLGTFGRFWLELC